MDKKKVLDVNMPIKDQKKLLPYLLQKKYQAHVNVGNGKIRYIYGDDPVDLEMFALSKGWKIVKTVKN